MRALRAIVVLLAMLVLTAACASTPRERGGYYSRGSIHSDSFPPNYVPGGGPGWGGHGRY